MKKIIITLLLFFYFYNLKAEKIWVNKYSKEYDQIMGFSCFDDQNCIAVIDAVGYTKVIKSTNKGESWEQIYFYDHVKTNDSIYSFHRVQILDSNNIYIAYSPRIIIQHSSDGGRSFKRITFDTLSSVKDDEIVSIKMYDTKIGVIITNKVLITTTDSWFNFKIIPLGKYLFSGEPIYFIDESNIAINRGHLASNDQLKFNLNSEKWSKYNDSIVYNKDEIRKQMINVCFIKNSDIGFACGGQEYGVGYFTRDIIWKTTNRGKNWEIIYENLYPESFSLAEMYFKDAMNGIITSAYGKIIVTTDGGESWNYIKSNTILENSWGLRGCIIDDYYLISTYRADIFRYEDDLSSIKLSSENELLIYPNPTQSNEIKLKIEGAEVVNITVVDILGNKKLQYTNFENKSNFDISKLINGLYIIQVQIDRQIYSQKLIVNR